MLDLPIKFKYEVVGITSEMRWNKVYNTNIAVSATMIVASKWDSSINMVSTAMIRIHVVGK